MPPIQFNPTFAHNELQFAAGIRKRMHPGQWRQFIGGRNRGTDRFMTAKAQYKQRSGK